MLNLLFLLLLIACNAFFVAAEFALVRSRPGRIDTTTPGGKRAHHQLEHINLYLSSCQIGVTMASIGIGFIGEAAFRDLLHPLIGDLSPTLSAILLFTFTYMTVTSLHIVLGEQVPKIYSIYHPERIATKASWLLGAFSSVLRPVIWLLSTISTWILRLLKVSTDEHSDQPASSEELRMMIVAAHANGELQAEEATMLSGVFRLHEQEAREVMTPSPKVTSIGVNASLIEAAQECITSGHTRLVVTNEEAVAGVVHLAALTEAIIAGVDTPLASLLRPVPLVPETKPLDELLSYLQAEHASLAVVLNEYGQMQGIVTIEDIVEEAVGEILDETDAEEPIIRVVPGGWVTPGESSLADLEDIGIHIETPSESFNSVGGYLFAELGRLPEVDDEVVADKYLLRVTEMDDSRIAEVFLSVKPEEAAE